MLQLDDKRTIEIGTSVTSLIETLKVFKDRRALPVILMTYFNPIYTYGLEVFAKRCEQAGVSGVIIPDLPMEEENLVAELLKQHTVSFIRLAALTSPEKRLKEIAAHTEGFL